MNDETLAEPVRTQTEKHPTFYNVLTAFSPFFGIILLFNAWQGAPAIVTTALNYNLQMVKFLCDTFPVLGGSSTEAALQGIGWQYLLLYFESGVLCHIFLSIAKTFFVGLATRLKN